jgi:hypothetical protein
MLTSFFGKSNPINFVVLTVGLVLGFVLGALRLSESVLSFSTIGHYILLLLLSIFSMFLLDFMIRKNDLTKQNTFGVFFYSCFLVMLPIVFLKTAIIIANVFILLALRRMLSLYSEKNTEKKIIDAAIWITLASFFYFYSLLFFIVLFVAIVRKSHTTYKHMLIPLAGFTAVFLLVTAYYFITTDSFAWFYEWKPAIAMDFSAYNAMKVVLPLSVIATLLVWTSTFRMFKLSSVPKKERPNYLFMLVVAFVSIAVALASPEKSGAEMLFVFAPTAIISANYLEQLNEFWFKEVLLWLVLLLPLSFLFL